jgi:hypothetical protein
MGPDKVCVGQTIALTDIVPGGNWFSHSPTIASIGLTTGIVTGVAAGYGPTTITYTLSTGCKATLEMSVNANPTAPGTITGPSIVSISGSPITLVCSPTGGTWSSSNNSKAIVDSGTGIVTGISIGTVIISYTETNSAGCSTYATKNITVGASPASTDEGITLYKAANEINKNEIALLPNPNKGDFRLIGTLGSITDEELSIEVVNMLGQLVYSTKSRTINREIYEHIWLNNSLFNGMYILYLKTSTRNLMFHFVVLQ